MADSEHPLPIEPGTHRRLTCRLCGKSMLPSTAEKSGGLCLDCFHAEPKRLAREARASAPGCPACDGSTTATAISFDWEAAQRGGEFAKYPRFLRAEKQVKRGTRYRCTHCGAAWYLQRDVKRQTQWHVPATHRALFEAWCEGTIRCDDRVLNVARRIGATPPDPYGNGADSITIPCRVTLRVGSRIDFALLMFTDLPPLPWVDMGPGKDPPLHLMTEVATIEPSRYALPRAVRFRTSLAVEQRMDFSPTAVQAPSGRRFLINRRPDFFEVDGIAGAELRLTSSVDGAQYVSTPHPPLTPFIGDRFAGDDNLRITGFSLRELVLSRMGWAIPRGPRGG